MQIPKAGAKKRHLGIPTVSDRVAQQVIKTYLEPRYDVMFTKSSLGYRPHNSAHQASKSCQQNGWKDEWVVALDIKSSFDTIDHQWMMRMPEVGTKQKWVLMYVPRWRQAPMQRPGGGQLKQRTKGTPQGGVISPLLANIYLHYGLDSWLENKHRDAAFERYADDVIIHCHSKERAQRVLAAIKERVAKFGLQVSGEKTKIVYGKRGNRPEKKEEIQKFTFLGQDVKPKTAKNSRTGKKFLSFLATASKAARIKMNQTLKAYNIQRRTDLSLKQIAAMINARVRRWLNYFEP